MTSLENVGGDVKVENEQSEKVLIQDVEVSDTR